MAPSPTQPDGAIAYMLQIDPTIPLPLCKAALERHGGCKREALEWLFTPAALKLRTQYAPPHQGALRWINSQSRQSRAQTPPARPAALAHGRPSNTPDKMMPRAMAPRKTPSQVVPKAIGAMIVAGILAAAAMHSFSTGVVPQPEAPKRHTTKFSMNEKLGEEKAAEDVIKTILSAHSLFERLHLPDAQVAPAALKKQYRRLALLVHPDKCTSASANEAFQKLGEAFDRLSSDVGQRTHLAELSRRQRSQRAAKQMDRWWHRELRKAAEELMYWMGGRA